MTTPYSLHRMAGHTVSHYAEFGLLFPLLQKLKAAGLQDEKLVSHWGEAVGKERDVGQTVFVPRDASM